MNLDSKVSQDTNILVILKKEKLDNDYSKL